MRTFALLSVCLLAACKHDTAAPPPPPAPVPQTQPAFAADSTGVPGTKDLAGLGQLPPMMNAEASHRAPVAVPVEKLFDALAQKGVAIANKHQVLARTAAASYCMLGTTDGTVAIAVCEYPTHDAALAGEKLLDGRYKKLVPDAVRAINGSTLVTVANADRKPAVRDRVLETFKAL
ncbi:MAG TPA: hypothetical protein VGG74_00815 [Kofleriaceae bacterium]|jgi:hypothetical protein